MHDVHLNFKIVKVGASLEFPLKIVLLNFFDVLLKFVSESALIYRNASYWLHNCAFSKLVFKVLGLVRV